MKLEFIGAAHEVTGSCHYLNACGKNILIDCGLEQGPDLYENQELPVSAGEIDYVLLTHAHIDHSGKIPLLCRQGFAGEIITTFATSDRMPLSVFWLHVITNSALPCARALTYSSTIWDICWDQRVLRSGSRRTR